jgi:hypothetical protein
MRITLLVFSAILFMAGCKSKTASKEKEKETQKADTAVVAPPAIDKETVLKNLTSDVMSLLKKKEYAALASHIHPDAGVRFSPYGHIVLDQDVIMRPGEFANEIAAAKQKTITWGEYDGTGEPIKMTLNKYLDSFVYTADFANPEVFKINTVTNPGNAQNNITTIYPASDFTDSHFSGFEKKYDGMDWQSLRLVFSQLNGKYYLVGIVHDQWTI